MNNKKSTLSVRPTSGFGTNYEVLQDDFLNENS